MRKFLNYVSFDDACNGKFKMKITTLYIVFGYSVTMRPIYFTRDSRLESK